MVRSVAQQRVSNHEGFPSLARVFFLVDAGVTAAMVDPFRERCSAGIFRPSLSMWAPAQKGGARLHSQKEGAERRKAQWCRLSCSVEHAPVHQPARLTALRCGVF